MAKGWKMSKRSEFFDWTTEELMGAQLVLNCIKDAVDRDNSPTHKEVVRMSLGVDRELSTRTDYIPKLLTSAMECVASPRGTPKGGRR